MSLTLSKLDAKLRNRIERQISDEDKAGHTRHNPKLECDIGPEPLAQDKAEKGATGRVHIIFISRRKRLCDPDNLSVKWLLDCLRYCGAIAGDEPEKITLEVKQEKCTKGQCPETIIEITEIL